MKQIHGIETTFDFGKLMKCSDLIWYDGPLLSHYMTETGDHYLYYWVDTDEHYNRWILIRSNIQTIKEYVNGRLSLKDVLSLPEDGIVWLADVDNEMNFHNTTMIPIASLPDEYLPENDSYFDGVCEDDSLLAESETYSLTVPEKDKSLFSSLIERMGWTARQSYIRWSRVAAL